MHGATSRIACIVGIMLLLESLPALIAGEKQKTLFRVFESISSFGQTEDRALEVDPSGRVSLTVKDGDILSDRSEKTKHEAVLNATELQALHDFLAGGAIQSLQGLYYDNDVTTDYAASMEIEINVLKEPKRVMLPHLVTLGEDDSKIYPAAVHELVCKVYGLEERFGIFTPTQLVSIDRNKREHHYTVCNSASLQLIPTPTP